MKKKLGKKRMMENLKSEKNELGKKQSGERGGIQMGRKKKSQGEGELKPRKWEKEKKSEREGDL